MGCFMSNLEIRRLDLSDAEAFMDYIHNWSTDTSPFKIDAVKTYAEVNLDNFAEYVEKIRKEEISAEKPDWSTATKYFAFINGQIAGEISCRWQIEKGILLEWGGHIGYGAILSPQRAPIFRPTANCTAHANPAPIASIIMAGIMAGGSFMAKLTARPTTMISDNAQT